MQLRSASKRLVAVLLTLASLSQLRANTTRVSASFSLNHSGSISTGSTSVLASLSNTVNSGPSTVSLAKFDSSLGTLTAVSVAITTNASTAGVSKTGLLSLLTIANYTRTLKADLSAGSVTRSQQGSASTSTSSLLGLLNLGGTQEAGGASVNTTFNITDPIEVTSFVGSGNISVAFSGTDTFDISTLASILSGVGISSSGNASGQVTVTYTYTPAVVATAPTIGTGPAAASVTIGGTATFTVIANGTAPFTYQWLKNGTPLSGATSSSLVLTNVGTGDAGNFSVTISNSAGSLTSAAAALTVNSAVTSPSIGTAPSAQTVSVGDTATFSVSAQGTAPFTYQWLKNGLPISGATSATLSLGNVSILDAGLYSVTVSNSAGSVTSGSAALTVNLLPTAPTINSQPAAQAVNVGNSVSFSVSAQGTAPLTYQWRKEGVAILLANSATFTLSSAQLSDAGTYSVVVTGLGGSVTSAGASLAVSSGNSGSSTPQITSQPAALSVSVGGTVSLSVGASGTGPITYQWSKNGTAISGATSASLIISNATTSDSGSYYVVVTNAAGSTTSNTALVVVAGVAPSGTVPSILTQPVSQIVAAGGSVNFSVAVGGSAPFTYQWNKNGAAISGATTASLALTNVQTSANGTYNVTVSNVAGSSTSASAQLTVQSSTGTGGGGGSGGGGSGTSTTLSVTVSPASQTIAAGSNASITATAAGPGTLTFQWLKSGAAISGATGTMLTIGNIQPVNAGDYSVVVSNDAGSVLSGTATINVQGAATVPSAPPGRLVNLSTRSNVGVGNNVLIGGFVVGGTDPKTLMIRAVGPKLADLGIKDYLADPNISIYRGSTLVFQNDNWSSATDADAVMAEAASAGAFALDWGSSDAALAVTLTPGAYTVIVSGNNNSTGVSLIELYDVSTNSTTALGDDIVNLSSRGWVSTGDKIMIAGFVVGGNSPKTMLIRGVGPGLASLGVSSVLPDPQLSLYQGSTVIMKNNDWTVGNDATAVRRVSQAVGAFPLADDSRDSAILITLNPGTYTAQISSATTEEGVALVEVYEVP